MAEHVCSKVFWALLAVALGFAFFFQLGRQVSDNSDLLAQQKLEETLRRLDAANHPAPAQQSRASEFSIFSAVAAR